MNTLSRLFFRFWRLATTFLVLALLAYLLFFHNLYGLLPGYANREIQARASAASLSVIIHNPINAPFTLPVWAALKLGYSSPAITRIVAASYGVLASILFFWIVRSWYRYRVAFMATILFATSSGFLHTARLGSPLILQMGVLAILGVLLWYRRTSHHRWVSYAIVGMFAVFWYVPGMVWFELLAIGLLHKYVWRLLRRIGWPHLVGWLVLWAIVVAPLVWAAVHSPRIIMSLAGLPTHFGSIWQVLQNIGNTALAISIRGPGNPDLWLGHMPLLDITETALLLLGVYLFVKSFRSLRGIALIGLTAMGIILVGLGGPVAISGLVPLAYLFIAGGLHVLLNRWLSVFPRNPVARSAGILMVLLLAFFSVLYQVRSYFVAWPHNPATVQTFQQRP